MILVTGANGVVGSYVKKVFNEEKLFLTDIDTLDITKQDSVLEIVQHMKPNIILHLAAQTDVDRCEQDSRDAFLVNTESTKNLALICEKFGIFIVYISSGAVYGGQEVRTYKETDVMVPINIYGKSKLEGEEWIKKITKKYLILRAGWMVGGKDKDKKFVGKILDIINKKTEIDVVNDKFGSITYAKDLLKCVKILLDKNYTGTFNVVNPGLVSRYDIAIEIVKILNKKIKINPVGSDKFKLVAPRPCSEAMENYNLEKIGLNILQPWQSALYEYLKE